jgi:hypothetical protein
VAPPESFLTAGREAAVFSLGGETWPKCPSMIRSIGASAQNRRAPSHVN